MTRLFRHERLWRLDDEPFHTAAVLLADAARRIRTPDLVIGIDRGGRRLAEVVAAHLGLPMMMVTARHNASDNLELLDTGQVHVDPIDRTRPAGQRVLLVDDICGSGSTLTAVTGVLAEAGTAGLTTAVLCRNAGAAVNPDLWIWDVTDWVVFPWERPTTRSTQPLPTPASARSR